MDGLYTIYDRAAKQYGPVFQAHNDDVARREMIRLLKSVAAWDRDSFVLYHVAGYNSDLGLVDGFGVPVEIDVIMPDIDEVKPRGIV